MVGSARAWIALEERGHLGFEARQALDEADVGAGDRGEVEADRAQTRE